MSLNSLNSLPVLCQITPNDLWLMILSLEIIFNNLKAERILVFVPCFVDNKYLEYISLANWFAIHSWKLFHFLNIVKKLYGVLCPLHRKYWWKIQNLKQIILIFCGIYFDEPNNCLNISKHTIVKIILIFTFWHHICSVAQLCPTFCDPMNCSMPGLPVHHQLLESTQTHVHWVGHAIQPSHPLSSPSPPALNLSLHQGLFKWVSSSQQVAKVLEFQLQHQSFQWTPRTDLL